MPRLAPTGLRLLLLAGGLALGSQQLVAQQATPTPTLAPAQEQGATAVRPEAQAEAAAAAQGGAPAETPATPAVIKPDSTAPADAGSSGWTGGTGGSFIGTTPSGPAPTSKSWQPPVARGLDLMMGQP